MDGFLTVIATAASAALLFGSLLMLSVTVVLCPWYFKKSPPVRRDARPSL